MQTFEEEHFYQRIVYIW